uniref:MPHOSPH9 n=1 Tax=Bursaphelenchus xylophilus TaxID=6326 RepID=A0A1I7SPT8_BURXY
KITPESNGSFETYTNSTTSLPTSAQDGTYMAETLTNDLDYMEYIRSKSSSLLFGC